LNQSLVGATAALLGGSGVVLAALGSHAITFEDSQAIRLWDIAVQMHLAHAVAILACAVAAKMFNRRALNRCALLMSAGVVMFSGSLYLVAAGSDQVPGIITPLGGFLLIVSWTWMGAILLRKSD